MPKEDIVSHGQAADDVSVLEDGAHPKFECRARGEASVLDAPDDDVPLVRVHHTRQDLHQRRFPGAILPDEAVDLTRVQVEADVDQGTRARVRLGDAF